MLAANIGKTFVAATVLDLESEARLPRDDRLSARLGIAHISTRCPTPRPSPLASF